MALGCVIPLAVQIATDANNDVVSGALANFFATGTTTPITVYSDVALTIPLTNPVVATGAGRFPEIFLGAGVSYDLDITTSGGVSLPGYPAINLQSTKQGTLLPYSPDWGNTGTANTAGAMTLTGRYTTVGDLTFVRIRHVWGAGTIGGNGVFTYTLPVAAVVDSAVANGLIATISDASAGAFTGHASTSSLGTTTIAVYVNNVVDGAGPPASKIAPSTGITATYPMVWTSTDAIEITGWYPTG